MSSQEHSSLKWTAIVVTCISEKIAKGIEEECHRLSAGGLLPDHDLLLVVADPKQPGKQDLGVGSGGAMINAVFVAIERMSALQQHTTINNELVHSSRILVVHLGRMLAHCPGGAAFFRINPHLTCIPQHLQITPPTVLQHTIWAATKLGEKTATGVWLTSLDTFLPFTSTMTYSIPTPEPGQDALVCTVQAPFLSATQHGVVITGEGRRINNMVYRMQMGALRKTFKDDMASVISGAVYLSSSLTEAMLELHVLPPLDRCTYYGTDSGIPSLQISLYFDLLLPLCCDVMHDEYVSGQYGTTYAKAVSYHTTYHQEIHLARRQIWNQLRGFKAVSWPLGELSHHYIGMNMSYKDSVLPLLPSSSVSYVHKLKYDWNSIVSVNSVIEGNVVTPVEKVYILDSWIGRDVNLILLGPTVMNGLHLKDCATFLKLPRDCIWQQYSVGPHDVVTSHGWFDYMAHEHNELAPTVFNTTWSIFLSKTGILKDDLWETTCETQNFLHAKLFLPGLPIVEQISILSALIRAVQSDTEEDEWISYMQKWKSHPRVSLAEAIYKCNVKKIIRTQESILLETVKQYLIRTADDLRGMCLIPIFQYFVIRGLQPVKEVLHVLHMLLHEPRPSTSRLLSNVADLLGCLAQGKGGLRSGPAANPMWRNALLNIKKGNQREAVQEMQELSEEWIKTGQPENLIRAARHYERASQISIWHQVDTGEVHVKPMWVCPEMRRSVGVGVWVEAHSPARLDLAGGWTDTPPMCYEQGGAVLNVAIKINKKKPIGARARFIPELQVVCVLCNSSGADERLTWTCMDDLRDYSNPVSPGALVKTVLLYSRLLDLNNSDSLAAQLKEKHGYGVQVELWSNLPQGSGLGGSSILAGTLLAALMVLRGHPPPSPTQLIHSILCVEQWLTTGGGWQDQVGGLLGGVKLGVSGRGTPLTVTPYQIPISQQQIEALNARLMLIYTGKVRLARNLLQTVIRNWYACDPTITKCFSELQHLALQAAGSMLDNNLKDLGTCIQKYWNLKKIVASGCEPNQVRQLIESLEGHCQGMALAGAGGGGYFFGLKTSDASLGHLECLKGFTCDQVEIDHQGLEVRIGEELVHEETISKQILTHEILNELIKDCK